MKGRFSNWIRREAQEYMLLLCSVPSFVVMMFCVCVVAMNILAGKELFTIGGLALDCGFTLSWISFAIMDMLCKRFGPKAAFEISLTVIIINLFICLVFWLVSFAPGHWGAYYSQSNDQSTAELVDQALNVTIRGNWYIVFGSMFASLVSSAVNSIVNWAVARGLRFDNFKAFAIRSYISTAVGQFVDNFIFAAVVSHVLFGWTWTEVLLCAAFSATFELGCEVISSPLAYRILKVWEKAGVGREYMDKFKK